MAKASHSLVARLANVARSFLHPAVLLHTFRMLHYYGYSHALQRRLMTLGEGVRLAPNTSFRNGARIALGDGVQLGEYCAIWAGRSTSWVRVGAGTTFGPSCFITAADYGLDLDRPVTEQEMIERDITIGPECWIGTKAVITAGVTLGAGCVIGAGSVVTKDIPANAIAAGNPARVLKMRE
ncbi:maltose O-acetyltransferase [Jannaschia sp. AI_61]|uniref:acyltransferase n=1 Tax=Jannaschia sp. AI_61 TaxID=2829796 RepID=UPI001BB8552E|nr:acyltransferase [Jannaschia sp. AI_61]GIT93296.1 maltose O-acetyltransferase [Jannaschia sp. AI_61]